MMARHRRKNKSAHNRANGTASISVPSGKALSGVVNKYTEQALQIPNNSATPAYRTPARAGRSFIACTGAG